jgi:hypothetical protein
MRKDLLDLINALVPVMVRKLSAQAMLQIVENIHEIGEWWP